MTVATGRAPLDQVGEHFAAGAAGLDRGGDDVRAGLRWLGDRGLLGAPGHDLPAAVSLVERIARECMSSAFSLWAHLMTTEYLRVAAPGGPLDGQLGTAAAVGSTAMAPALRDVAGLDPVPVRATPVNGGYRLDGPIRWASNLFPDTLVVLPVRVGETGPERAVVAFRLADPGVRPHERPELLALNATASGSVTLDGLVVPERQVLARDLPGFVATVRPTFLLLQTAFCLGLAHRAADEAVGHLAGSDTVLRGDVERVAAAVSDARLRLHEAAAHPETGRPAQWLRLRLDAAEAAVRATRTEATVRGGAGYVTTSAVSRRLREAAFLPIQAPTEGHLRWELSRCA